MKNHPKYALRAFVAFALTGLALFSTGCASIVHGGPRTLEIKSDPSGATITITKLGTAEVVHSATTPCTVSLDQKRGYFKGQSFTVKFELAGYKSTEVVVRHELSGWYFGNLLLGGLIGMIGVDPATGAMWNLTPDKIEQKLSAEQASVIRQRSGFLVVLVSQMTESEKKQMVRVN
ncbi:MAG: hypothetical protein QM790_05500 [Nibricoccus sp.]